MIRFAMSALAGLGLLASVACSDDITAPDASTQLASVVPAGGSVNVDPGSSMVVEFSYAMMAGMESYMVLHEGDVRGPVVSGTWTWSPERTRATFTPGSPLRSQTQYTLHLGGGMMDGNGAGMGFGDHGRQMGGQWATGQMMGGSSGMLGSGWGHGNGTYGMVFTFTTR
jgi:hypothetical protein